jgi:hypothetical protein
MRKQRVNTGLGGWRIEQKLRLPILLRHRVIALYSYASIATAPAGRPDPKNRVVPAINETSQDHSQQHYTAKDFVGPLPHDFSNVAG